MINKQSGDSSLENITDAQIRVPWLGRILGFGDLVVMTASEAGINNLRALTDPIGFKKAMMETKTERMIDLNTPRGTAQAQLAAAAAAAAAPAPHPPRRPRPRRPGPCAGGPVGRRGHQDPRLARHAARFGRDHARGVRGQEDRAARPDLALPPPAPPASLTDSANSDRV